MKQRKTLILIVVIFLFSSLSTEYASAAGTVILPSGGAGYAPGLPCRVINIGDDGSIYETGGTFNDAMECKVSYGVILKDISILEEQSTTFFTTLYNNIVNAVQAGTALITNL